MAYEQESQVMFLEVQNFPPGIYCHAAVIPLTLFSPQAVPSWTWAGSGISDPKSKSEDQHKTPDALLTTLQAGRFWRLTDVHWSFPHRLCLYGIKDTQISDTQQIKISIRANPFQLFTLHLKKYSFKSLTLRLCNKYIFYIEDLKVSFYLVVTYWTGHFLYTPPFIPQFPNLSPLIFAFSKHISGAFRAPAQKKNSESQSGVWKIPERKIGNVCQEPTNGFPWNAEHTFAIDRFTLWIKALAHSIVAISPAVAAGVSIHDVNIIGAVGCAPIAVLREITDVLFCSALCSCHFKLGPERENAFSTATEEVLEWNKDNWERSVVLGKTNSPLTYSLTGECHLKICQED